MVVLPYACADDSLRALAGRAEGFGRHAVGGFHGPIYHVTNLADDGCGSLREACRKKEPLWIVFELSGTITLSSNLKVSSYKTIDGRGQKVKLKGKSLQLKECEHVIVCNVEFEGGDGADVDAIQIKPRSRHVWIDRCSLSNYPDGLIDITNESTAITISRCYFRNHNKTILIGADCNHVRDRWMSVTIHHCFFDGTNQRHPRVRFAQVHLYNNFTRNWGIYAVGVGVEAKIVSQCNIYEAGDNKKRVFKYLPEKAQDREECTCGSIISEGDLFLNGAQSNLPTNNEEDDDDDVSMVCFLFQVHHQNSNQSLQPATPALKQAIQLCAGWQDIPRPADLLGNHSI